MYHESRLHSLARLTYVLRPWIMLLVFTLRLDITLWGCEALAVYPSPEKNPARLVLIIPIPPVEMGSGFLVYLVGLHRINLYYLIHRQGCKGSQLTRCPGNASVP